MPRKKKGEQVNSKLAPFEDQIGEVPAEKLAEIAEVSVEEVREAERELGFNSEEAPPDEEDEPDPDTDEEDPAPEYVVRTRMEEAADEDPEEFRALISMARAAKRAGWKVVNGKAVPPAPRGAPPRLVIRLKRAVTYTATAANGKRVSVTLGRSIYRDAMARKVMEIVKGDPELIERIEG